MQVHAGHPLGRFLGVVIVFDVDHQAAQQLTHLAGHLQLQLIHLAVEQVLGDVVVGQEGHAGGLETFADAAAHRRQLAGKARGEG